MALAPDIASSTDPVAVEGSGEHIDAPQLQLFVMGLFFIFGGITSLNDVIIPKLKELFTLNYTQAMLVQFCFFTAYAVIGIPGARLVKRIGYMRGAVAGLLTMMVGCLLFIPASQSAAYPLFLFALFVLASGVVLVQVVSNPLISLLGKAETAHSRLTFAQAFNSLGTVAFPLVGSFIVLGGFAAMSLTGVLSGNRQAYATVGVETIMQLYVGIAFSLAIVGVVVWRARDLLKGERHEVTTISAGVKLLGRPRFGYGALCIFLYVGAEVAIGSIIVNYLMDARVLALSEAAAYPMISLYWGGAMIGRFIGSALLRMVSPGKLLAAVSVGAILLIAISTQTTGTVSGYSLLAIGLMNAIMFPTIFSLACEKLGPRAADGSGIINVAIFGGAVIPLLTGVIADVSGSLAFALVLPMACYAIIAAFGIYARRPAI